jgi:outer membrane protein assembly factor BamE (lipoprotein component of BamABCDE complex)
MKKYIIFASVLFVLSGCASTAGNETINTKFNTIKSEIKEGSSTKNYVRQSLGNPSSTTLTENGLEIWKYNYARAVPQADAYIPFARFVSSTVTVSSKEVTILFDKNDVVSKITTSEKVEDVKKGMAH